MTAQVLFEKFTHKKVLIIGDVMIDRYLWGQVHRISPEAPVPVVLEQQTDDRLGGAANVALNVKALGATPILCSVTGSDKDEWAFKHLLKSNAISTEGIIVSKRRKTTVKTRILGNKQQMLRIDKEDIHDLDAEEERQILRRTQNLLKTHDFDIAILQDYNKGVLSARVIKKILKLTAQMGVPVVVDPKKNNFFSYTAVALFKPNLKEVRDNIPFAVGTDKTSLDAAAQFLFKSLKAKEIMITLSEHGIYWANATQSAIYPTRTRNVADVSGAGDTVISMAALCLTEPMEPEVIAGICNLAGGQVCQTPGVVPIQLTPAFLQEVAGVLK